MASSIDTTQPPAGSATTLAVRNNFAAAKSEIEALQAAVGAFPSHLGAFGIAKISTEPVISASNEPAIDWDDATLPSNVFHDPVLNPSEFVIPAGYAGTYIVTAAVSFTPSGVGPVDIYLSAPSAVGLTSQYDVISADNGKQKMIFVQEVMALAEADAVSVFFGNWTDNALTVMNSAGYFSIAKIG